MFGDENAQKVRDLQSQAQLGSPEYTLKELTVTKFAEIARNAATGDWPSNAVFCLGLG